MTPPPGNFSLLSKGTPCSLTPGRKPDRLLLELLLLQQEPPVPALQLGQLLVEAGGVVALDAAVAGAGHGVDGALVLLKAGGGYLGSVYFLFFGFHFSFIFLLLFLRFR